MSRMLKAFVAMLALFGVHSAFAQMCLPERGAVRINGVWSDPPRVLGQNGCYVPQGGTGVAGIVLDAVNGNRGQTGGNTTVTVTGGWPAPQAVPQPVYRTQQVRVQSQGGTCLVNGEQGVIVSRSSWDTAEGTLWNGVKILGAAAISSFIGREVFQAAGWNTQGVGTFFGLMGGLTEWGETLRPEYTCVVRSGGQSDTSRIVQSVRGGETMTRPGSCKVGGIERGAMSLEACTALGKPYLVQRGGEQIVVSTPAKCDIPYAGVGHKVIPWMGTPESCINFKPSLEEFNALQAELLPG